MEKPRSFRAEAIVLRHSDWGEADRMLVLFTRQQGKVRALAKGARKIRSRKAGHLEPFTRVTLQLAAGRDLLIVTQAETLEAYQPVREDLVLTGYAAYLVELLDRFTYDEESFHPSIFNLLGETLARLCSEPEPLLAVRYYEVRLLDYLGFRPQLFQCANCGREIKAEDQFFSGAAGGVLCPRCGTGLPGVKPISVDALRYLRHFQRSSYGDSRRARPAPETQAELESLMQYYLTYTLERGLNSPEFIKKVRQKNGRAP
ncbi:MAG: DNA repair protein RecO [Chloroflexota bacterium]